MSYSVKFKNKAKHQYVKDCLALLARAHDPRISIAEYLYKMVRSKARQNKIKIKAPE